MSGGDDEVARRFRDVLRRRQFVDHEPGMLLIWLAAGEAELADLVLQVEARHPGARFSVQRSGSATVVQVTARNEELTAIERLYVTAGS